MRIDLHSQQLVVPLRIFLFLRACRSVRELDARLIVLDLLPKVQGNGLSMHDIIYSLGINREM